MPLAISRARIFWSRTPKAHLTYMDFVQIACEGLLSAVDKFVPPYTPVFRSVAIGRMHGNFIEEYSETQLHFFPVDRRKIYRANKVIGRMGGIHNADFEELARVVNEGVEDGHRTNAIEIADLMAAASVVSSDGFAVFPDGDDDSNGLAHGHLASDPNHRPDVQVEEAQVSSVLKSAVAELTLLERKVLRMKGITL